MSELRREIETLIVENLAAEDAEGFFRRPRLGVASADDSLFEEVPRVVGDHHLRPKDILPEAATVLSFFLPFSEKVVQGNRGPGPVSTDWGWSYVRANEHINRLSQAVIDLAVVKGGRAATIPATHTFDEVTLQTSWSHRSAALVAGLGRFGINRMLIGPKGGAGRYGTVFISQKLEPDPRPADDFCLYLKNGKCGVCLKACPAEALSPDGFDGQKCYTLLKANSAQLDLGGRKVNVCGKCVVTGPCAYHE